MKIRTTVTSFIFLLIIMILCACLFGCNGNIGKNKDEYVEGKFMVGIGADYKNAFSEQEFTVADFGSEYIESIEYYSWYSSSDSEEGLIYIKLKEQYKDKLEEVMRQVNDLDFVTYVQKIGYAHAFA